MSVSIPIQIRRPGLAVSDTPSQTRMTERSEWIVSRNGDDTAIFIDFHMGDPAGLSRSPQDEQAVAPMDKMWVPRHDVIGALFLRQRCRPPLRGALPFRPCGLTKRCSRLTIWSPSPSHSNAGHRCANEIGTAWHWKTILPWTVRLRKLAFAVSCSILRVSWAPVSITTPGRGARLRRSGFRCQAKHVHSLRICRTICPNQTTLYQYSYATGGIRHAAFR